MSQPISHHPRSQAVSGCLTTGLPRSGVRPVALSIAAALLGMVSVPAQAQETAAYESIQNPPVLQGATTDTAAAGATAVQGQARAQGEVAAAAAQDAAIEPTRTKTMSLNVGYVNTYLWNPTSGKYDRVHLRSYDARDNAPLVAPTIDVVPGTRMNITLNNNLPAENSEKCNDSITNGFHCPNTTNLHTHGLWVNPGRDDAGVPSDDIFQAIAPGHSLKYKIDIPSDHPAGTFWYHTHFHGSTALQVSSGMAGALIVRGDRQPTAQRNGDLDTLLRSTGNTQVQERVVMLQQIQYACRGADGKIKRAAAPDGATEQVRNSQPYACDDGEAAGVEDIDDFGPNGWFNSGRHTTINGTTMARFVGAVAGRMERWRIIHGGVRESINLEFRPAVLNNMPPSEIRNLSGRRLQNFINNNCTGAPLTHYRVAADGLTMANMQPATETVFQPGYRWDLMMTFPRNGYYCVIDKSVPVGGSINNTPAGTAARPAPQTLLGIVQVNGGVDMDTTAIPGYVKQQMLSLADANIFDEEMRAAVVADLNDGLKLSHFTPHATIAQSELNQPTRKMNFSIVAKDPNNIPGGGFHYYVNGKEYDKNADLTQLKLGGVQEWEISSEGASHPYHIHVNPFQIVSIIDPQGRDVSGFDAPDNSESTIDTQFRGLKGVWKDTIMIKHLRAGAEGVVHPGTYTVNIRTRYERYKGDFVMHCHILDHEDKGMMEGFRITDATNVASKYAPVPVCSTDTSDGVKFRSPYGVKNPLSIPKEGKLQTSMMFLPKR